MQKVIILHGGTHHYHNANGAPCDVYSVQAENSMSVLRKYIGQSIGTMGYFPGVKRGTIIDVFVEDNNAVAIVE